MKRLFPILFICIASYSLAIDPNDPFAHMRERMDIEFPGYESTGDESDESDELESNVEMVEQEGRPATPLHGSEQSRPMTPPRQQAYPLNRNRRIVLFDAAAEEARRQEAVRLAALREQELERLRLLMAQQRAIDANDKISGFGTWRRG